MSSCEPCMRQGKQSSGAFNCEDCEELLCYACRRDHIKFRQFADHSITAHYLALNQISRGKTGSREAANPSYRLAKEGREEGTYQKLPEKDFSQTEAGKASEEFIDTFKDCGDVHVKAERDTTLVDDDLYTYIDMESIVSMREPRYFPVLRVLESELARKIDIVGNSGYAIVTSGHVIFTSNQSCVSINFSIIRRFSVTKEKEQLFKIEVGRRFKQGEGIFDFVMSYDESWALYNYCNEMARTKTTGGRP